MHYNAAVGYLLCYFSATGNTLNAATKVAEAIRSAGNSCELFSIESRRPRHDWRGEEFTEKLKRVDVLVLLFPVHSWSPPALVLRFIRSLPRPARLGGPQRAAIVAVDGGDGFGAARKARRRLEGRGYRVFYSGRAGYPDNWSQMMEPPGPKEAEIEREAGALEAFQIGEEIGEGKEQHYAPGGVTTFALGAIGWTFRLVGRRLLGQFYSADKRCTTCRLCAVTCPVGAIRIPRGSRARPGWYARCESCNRCINICPEGAIVTSPGRIILITAAIGAIAYALYVLGSRTWLPESVVFRATAVVAAIVVAHVVYFFFPAPLFRLIYRVPGLRSLLSAGFNRTWHRYRFPGFQPQQHSKRRRSGP